MQKFKWLIIRLVIAALITAVLTALFSEYLQYIEIAFFFVIGLIIGFELNYGKTLTGNRPLSIKVFIVLALIAFSILAAITFTTLQSYALFLPGFLAGPLLKQVLMPDRKVDLSKDACKTG